MVSNAREVGNRHCQRIMLMHFPLMGRLQLLCYKFVFWIGSEKVNQEKGIRSRSLISVFLQAWKIRLPCCCDIIVIMKI